MDHRLVQAVEKSLRWSGPERIGREFARGTLIDTGLRSRLLTPARMLDLVMRRSLAPHRLRCLVNGADIHPQGYLTMSTTRRGYSVPVADMRRIGSLLQSGCTLILDQTNVYDPTLEVACRAFQWWSRETVQVNTYLTTGPAAGFDLHWDDHDVIVVQLAGEKSWEVRGPSRPAPMFRDSSPSYEPSHDIVWEGTVEAGEVMHIPRGYWHRATRQEQGDGYSLHATFGFHKQTGVNWLAWLVDQSREHELFRHDLNRWAATDERVAQEHEIARAFADLLHDRSSDNFLAMRERQRSPGRAVVTHGIFGVPSIVACVADFAPSIDRDGEQVIVRTAGKEITFRDKALPALNVLLSGGPVNVEQVGIATGVDAVLLAEVLVEEEVCAEVTAELASGYADLVIPQAS